MRSGAKLIVLISFLSILSYSCSIIEKKAEIEPEIVKKKIEGAKYVGSEFCAACHAELVESIKKTPHQRGWLEAPLGTGCESCHGPGGKHAEGPSKDTIVNKADMKNLTPIERSALCLQCHRVGRTDWLQSAHVSAGVTCDKCHFIPAMHQVGELKQRAGYSLQNPRLCLSCHNEKEADFRLQYRHPVLEGRVKCTDCHDPHETWGAMTFLRERDETCFKCHLEKKGPFVWEHAALDEGCTRCHLPHGSVNRRLLAQPSNGLCLSCHFETSFPRIGRYDHRFFLSRGARCFDCHFEIHGSNRSRYFNPAF